MGGARFSEGAARLPPRILHRRRCGSGSGPLWMERGSANARLPPSAASDATHLPLAFLLRPVFRPRHAKARSVRVGACPPDCAPSHQDALGGGRAEVSAMRCASAGDGWTLIATTRVVSLPPRVSVRRRCSSHDSHLWMERGSANARLPASVASAATSSPLASLLRPVLRPRHAKARSVRVGACPPDCAPSRLGALCRRCGPRCPQCVVPALVMAGRSLLRRE